MRGILRSRKKLSDMRVCFARIKIKKNYPFSSQPSVAGACTPCQSPALFMHQFMTKNAQKFIACFFRYFFSNSHFTRKLYRKNNNAFHKISIFERKFSSLLAKNRGARFVSIYYNKFQEENALHLHSFQKACKNYYHVSLCFYYKALIGAKTFASQRSFV